MKFITGLTVIIFLLTSACTMQNSPAQKPQIQQQQTKNEKVVFHTELAVNVEETAKKIKAVKESVAVVIDKEISVAVKVTGFDRLKLKSIRKEVHERITQLAPGYTVHVTTDKKLFSELQKLKKQIPHAANPVQIKNKLKKINQDMRG